MLPAGYAAAYKKTDAAAKHCNICFLFFYCKDNTDNSVQHAYCKRLKTILGRAMPTVELDSPTNVQISNLLTASSHQEFSDFALDVANILTEKEYQVIVLVYKYQLSSAEIARRLCATRQNVNQGLIMRTPSPEVLCKQSERNGSLCILLCCNLLSALFYITKCQPDNT